MVRRCAGIWDFMWLCLCDVFSSSHALYLYLFFKKLILMFPALPSFIFHPLSFFIYFPIQSFSSLLFFSLFCSLGFGSIQHSSHLNSSKAHRTTHKEHQIANSHHTAGRWLLSISIPPTYPLHPPQLRFLTPIVHPNIALSSGEICLDLLKDAWTPAYSVLECVRAVRMLLSCPETDSPLNVDAAALLRGGDVVGARRLVECWCAEEGRYEGA